MHGSQMTHSLYTCPICQQRLTFTERSWRCTNNHTYDIHKKGYVNLLLSQHKNSKAPGDDAAMIQSRRRFLESEQYGPLATRISDLLAQRLPEKAKVLDAGCGEGYYTNIIARNNPEFDCYGLDISKPAILAACKYQHIQWSVASSNKAPFLNDSFDAIISVFSRIDNDSFDQILKSDGSVCIVTPDQDHLMQLRELIYETVRPYETEKHKGYLDSRFELTHEERITMPINLETPAKIMDLVGMTPHAHRLSSQAKEKLMATEQLVDQACFKIYWFKKA